MKKSIKFSLFSLLMVLNFNVWCPDMEVRPTTPERTESSRAEQAQEAAINRTLNKDRNLFFHSDRVTNLRDIKNTQYDTPSWSFGIRRWWSHLGNKGDLAIVEDAFKKGAKFDNFNETEKAAFQRLNANDQVTLVQQYLDGLKNSTVKQMSIPTNAFNDTQYSLRSELKPLLAKRKKLENEIAALKNEKTNRYSVLHIFMSSEDKGKLIAIRTQELETLQNNQINPIISNIKNSIQRYNNAMQKIRDNFDTKIKQFSDLINPLLKDNIQLRFDVKTDTFQIHKKNSVLTTSMEIPISQSMQAAADQITQNEATTVKSREINAQF